MTSSRSHRTVPELDVRTGDQADLAILLRLLDATVEWLTARGITEQWGDRPWSQVPERVEQVRAMLREGRPYIAEADGEPIGVLILDYQLPYAPPADEPDVYITLLLTARSQHGRGVGTRLIEFAREDAAIRRIGLLRVDCWAGGDGRLIRYYESQGFVPKQRIEVRDGVWVQVFEQRI